MCGGLIGSLTSGTCSTSILSPHFQRNDILASWQPLGPLRDQSAARSPVLEGITGLPFPRQDGAFTKFPAEIILHHSTGELVMTATIIPSASHTQSIKGALQDYSRRKVRPPFTAISSYLG